MTEDELDALLGEGLELAYKKLIEEQDTLQPTFICISANGERQIVETPVHNQEEKSVIAHTMRARMRRSGTIAFAFISENWSAPALRGWTFSQPFLVNEHPDRFETVIVRASDREKSGGSIRKIRRDSAGRVVALDRFLPPGGSGMARFDSLLDEDHD